MSWAFGKSIFHFFEIFEWWSLKPFIGKARQNVKNILDPKVGHMRLFRKLLWSYLQLKTKCSEPLKMAFFSDEVETVFWESECFYLNIEKQQPEVFCVRKGVLRNFTKFTGKHVCQGLFFIKLQASSLKPATLLKKRLWR